MGDTYMLSEKVGCFTLKCLSCTRWSANADAFRALRKGYNIVSDTLLEMSENQNENAATKYEARCLYRKIKAFENALNNNLGYFVTKDKFNQQKSSIITCSIEAVVPLYESLESFVNNVRGTFDELEEEASVLVGGISYTKFRKRRIPKALDDSMNADVMTDLSERDQFIFQTHYVICDSLIFNLNKRKKEYHILQNRFGFLSNICNLPKSQLCQVVKKFQEIYSEDIDEEFVEESLQFSEFMPSASNAT